MGIGTPDGRLFIRSNGSYKELKLDPPKTRLAELTDIDNAAKANLRDILTRAKNGYTFLSPQAAFAGVKVLAGNVEGLDLSPYRFGGGRNFAAGAAAFIGKANPPLDAAARDTQQGQ